MKMNPIVFLKKKISKLIFKNLPFLTVEQLKINEIKEKIVEGRIAKRLNELVLLSQPYIKDSSLTVEDLVKQAAAKIGENIKVRRFTRYTLGEGIEKNQMDFAEEVASMQTN